MANPLTLKLILAGATKAVNELRPLDKQSRATADGLKQSRDALKLLNGQLGQITGIRQLSADLGRQSNALTVLRTNLASVTRTYGANSEQARGLQAQVDKATAAYDKQRHALVQMRTAATNSGIKNLTADQQRLQTEIASTNSAMAQQKARLEALAAAGSRKAAQQQRFNGTRATAGNLAMAGAAGLGTAYGVRRALTAPLHQIREYDTSTVRMEALGLGKDDTQRAIEYARGLKTYGTSRNDNLSLMLDATTAFADVEHAKMVMPTLAEMKFANQAAFGDQQGAENERKFMDMLKVIEARNGLSSKDEFIKQANMVQRVITATGGRVDATQWLDFVKTGGLAAKGLSSEAMYYQLEPLVQIMSGNRVGTATMSAYQNLYQGRTSKRAARNIEKLGLIGDPSKVQHDKAGQTSFLNPGALKGSELFERNQFEWMEKVMLPAFAARGITKDRDVKAAIGSIFSNRTAADLFGQMYVMRDQIHKNAKLNAGAFGITELAEREKNAMRGKEVNTEKRFDDAMLATGEAIQPIYLKLLSIVTPLLEGFTAFVAEHPKLASSLGTVALVVGVAAAGFGALGLALAAMLGPWAIVSLSAARFASMGGRLIGFIFRLGPALMTAGSAMLRFGLMLATNPIAWVIAGIVALAAAAYLIYRNWEPIKQWMAGVWSSIADGASAAWERVKAWASTAWQDFNNWLVVPLKQAGQDAWTYLQTLPTRFLQAGADMMNGMVDGITSRIAAVRDAIGSAADGAIGWFRQKLDMHSPSRVFIEAGANIGEGAALGIDRARPLLRAAALGLAGATAGALPAMAAAFPLADGVIDSRPPLAAGGAGRGRAPINIQGDTITINITAAPGGDAQALARAIRAELERMEAAKRARVRGAFIDFDN